MLKKFKQYITDAIILQKKKWYNLEAKDVDEDVIKRMFTLYTIAYKEIGTHIKDMISFKVKYKLYWLIDLDRDPEPDAFIAYKETPFGSKIAVMGTDGRKDAKKELIKQLISLVKIKPWYIEASDKLKDILSKENIPILKDPKKIKIIMGDYEIEVLDDKGNYNRVIDNIGKHTKTIFGKPKV